MFAEVACAASPTSTTYPAVEHDVLDRRDVCLVDRIHESWSPLIGSVSSAVFRRSIAAEVVDYLDDRPRAEIPVANNCAAPEDAVAERAGGDDLLRGPAIGG